MFWQTEHLIVLALYYDCRDQQHSVDKNDPSPCRCYTATMSDTASHSSPQLDTAEVRHTLSVQEVATALAAAGVPRSHRSIIRYCENAMLDAVKVHGPTGEQWFVAPASIPKAIGDLKQLEALRARQGAPEPDMASSGVVEKESDNNTDTASHSAPQPAMAEKETSQKTSPTEPVIAETQPAMARYVEQLEKRIEEKDDVIGLLKGQLIAKDQQIGELSTRYRETHTLLGAMQRMLAPLLGQGDPYKAPEKREPEPAGTEGIS